MNSSRMHCACNEIELLEMIRRHDKHAFDILYKKYWYPLFHFSTHYLEDEDTCKEIVQELFVHLYSRHTSLKIRSSVSSYLFTALRNRIINYIRNKAIYKKHVTLAINTEPRTQNNVEEFINLIELRKKITLSLNQMSVKYKEVYVVHNQSDYKVKKIALLLNRPIDTVEKQLRKATALIRDQLKDSKWTTNSRLQS